jgi:DNA primase
LSFIYSFIDWANHNLVDNDEAQNYLFGRGVSEEQCQRHKLGFIPECFEVDVNKDPGHDRDICRDKSKDYLWCDSCRFVRWSSEYVEAGERKEYKLGHRIVGHIVLPLTDYTANCVGFQIRSLTTKAYDTFAIRRRPFGYFFGTASAIHSIWAKKSVVLTEGAFDHLILERLVAPNVLALTTSTIGRAQTRFLRRFVDVIYWCADLDDAGRNGLKSLIRFHGDAFDIRDVKYPKLGKDPGKIWQKVGDDRFKSIFTELISV